MSTLLHIPDPPVDFTAADWKKMNQIINVLQIFKDATVTLSHRDASISMVIPIVTSIISDLEEETDQDVGVKGMKRDLKKAMETRFAGKDLIKCFILAKKNNVLLGQINL